MSEKILLTGGAGYIGIHTAVKLVEAGHDVIILDNLSNSKYEAVRRAEDLTQTKLPFVEADIRDEAALKALFEQHTIKAIIHFAGLKAVGESVEKPLAYYDNNVTGTLRLLEAALSAGVKQMVFSSSATVYGDPEEVPVTELAATGATNPYGQTKHMVEQILQDLCVRPGNDFKAVLLRYFNPIGAHPSGRLGEDPNGIPNNLLPYIAQVAVGRRECLTVFGDDYPGTVDGTGMRDYIHVQDLAQGHVLAVETMDRFDSGARVYNLGTGNAFSVLQMVSAFAKASGKDIPYQISERRPGDIGINYANAQKAKAELGWEAQLGLEEMVTDTWRWQSQNVNGYEES